jgi:hypothetical protein
MEEIKKRKKNIIQQIIRKERNKNKRRKRDLNILYNK